MVLLFAAFPAAAQTSGDVISRSPASTAQSDSTTATNAAGDAYSLDQVAAQLRELHRVVEQTMPMLDAISQSNSPTAEPQSRSGRLAGIVGSILNRDGSTNGTERSTNVLAGLLRGVLGANATASIGTNTATLSDLTALRDQLANLTPILQRLAPTADQETSATNHLAPTGRR